MLRSKRNHKRHYHNHNHHNVHNNNNHTVHNNNNTNYHYHSIDPYGLGWQSFSSEPQSATELKVYDEELDEDSERYFVEAVRSSKYDFRRRKFAYQLKWLGYEESQNSFEYDTTGCEDLVVEYWERKALKEITRTGNLKKNIRKKLKKKLKQSKNRRIKTE